MFHRVEMLAKTFCIYQCSHGSTDYILTGPSRGFVGLGAKYQFHLFSHKAAWSLLLTPMECCSKCSQQLTVSHIRESKTMYLPLCLRSSSTSIKFLRQLVKIHLANSSVANFFSLIIMANSSDIGDSTVNDTWPELRLKNTSKSVYWVVFIKTLWFHL